MIAWDKKENHTSVIINPLIYERGIFEHNIQCNRPCPTVLIYISLQGYPSVQTGLNWKDNVFLCCNRHTTKNQQTVGKNWGPTFLFPSSTKGYLFIVVSLWLKATATVWICEKICKHLQLKTWVSSHSIGAFALIKCHNAGCKCQS